MTKTEQNQAYYAANKELVKQRAVAWNKANPDKRREIVRRNNEKRKEAKRQWYLANRERVIAASSARNRRDPNRTAIVMRSRDKKQYGAPQVRDVCAMCGSRELLCVHHADGNNGRRGKPLNNEPTNLIVLCRSCHASVHGHWGLKEVTLPR